MQSILTNDGKLIEMSIGALKMSIFLGDMISQITDQEPIPVPNIDSHLMKRVIEFCQFYADHPGQHQRKAFNRDFFCHLDQNELAKLSAAANYLDIPLLMDSTVQHLSSLILKEK